MPAPAAPTGLTLIPAESGSPVSTLAWAHTGVDLDRFQVLRRAADATEWESVHVGDATEFGTGPYSFLVASTAGTVWTVRALNSNGEVST